MYLYTLSALSILCLHSVSGNSDQINALEAQCCVESGAPLFCATYIQYGWIRCSNMASTKTVAEKMESKTSYLQGQICECSNNGMTANDYCYSFSYGHEGVDPRDDEVKEWCAPLTDEVRITNYIEGVSQYKQELLCECNQDMSYSLQCDVLDATMYGGVHPENEYIGQWCIQNGYKEELKSFDEMKEDYRYDPRRSSAGAAEGNVDGINGTPSAAEHAVSFQVDKMTLMVIVLFVVNCVLMAVSCTLCCKGKKASQSQTYQKVVTETDVEEECHLNQV